MQLIDGKSVAAAVIAECQLEITELLQQGIQPGLAVVIVGDDPASHVYVGSKVKTCAELGMHSEKIQLPASTSQQELLEVVQR
ncbi:MAG: bifunctional methylenetetrahydrofolate dehydrogenase/methenyltetrahydrofolate cyclohydrolase FolD, partial [Verrucomicrobiota bacterium]